MVERYPFNQIVQILGFVMNLLCNFYQPLHHQGFAEKFVEKDRVASLIYQLGCQEDALIFRWRGCEIRNEGVGNADLALEEYNEATNPDRLARFWHFGPGLTIR